MQSITLTVYKSKVMDEVTKTSAYTGSKMVGDESAYDRIFATDGDEELLERFWAESQVAVCETFKKYLQGYSASEDDPFIMELGLSSSFDQTLISSMEQELFSFFVMNITAKWFAFTNKTEAADYGTAAAELLVGVHKKAVFKKRPTRPTY